MSTPFPRRRTRAVRAGKLIIGGGEPISVQTMTKTDTRDVGRTVEQILRLEELGLSLIRCAVPDMEAARALGKIRERVHIPLAADIHFDFRLALEALEQGVEKLRLNPGNIREREKISQIARKAGGMGVPIRIGVNAGSLNEALRSKHGGITPEAMVESALEEVAVLESAGFGDIVISLKASDIPLTIQSYRLLAGKCPYPFHAGITEAGTLYPGSIRSAAGIGILLSEGLCDTIRVSLTADSAEEVKAGNLILESLDLKKRGPLLISCPTCGRTEIDLFSLAAEVEKKLEKIKTPIRVAVMGCVVNGPGEAREADVGIAGGKGSGILFRRGQIVRTLSEAELLSALMEEIERMGEEQER
ncbi:MAG: flavodoxin-dependent (E)-4-hydroxy-3-methylbut-2-enyl-diphosphate synthase [bacterium]